MPAEEGENIDLKQKNTETCVRWNNRSGFLLQLMICAVCHGMCMEYTVPHFLELCFDGWVAFI